MCMSSTRKRALQCLRFILALSIFLLMFYNEPMSATDTRTNFEMPATPSLHDKITTELQRMEEDCTVSGKSHFNAASRWTRWNYIIGIPSVGLSAAAGAAFFKDYAVVAGLMSSGVTILTALMTFLKPSERSSGHKSSGDQYLSLRNDARVFREIALTQITDDIAAIAGMSGLTTRRNELNQASPQFSRGDFNAARKGIAQGEALHQIDKVNS